MLSYLQVDCVTKLTAAHYNTKLINTKIAEIFLTVSMFWSKRKRKLKGTLSSCFVFRPSCGIESSYNLTIYVLVRCYAMFNLLGKQEETERFGVKFILFWCFKRSRLSYLVIIQTSRDRIKSFALFRES